MAITDNILLVLPIKSVIGYSIFIANKPTE